MVEGEIRLLRAVYCLPHAYCSDCPLTQTHKYFLKVQYKKKNSTLQTNKNQFVVGRNLGYPWGWVLKSLRTVWPLYADSQEDTPRGSGLTTIETSFLDASERCFLESLVLALCLWLSTAQCGGFESLTTHRTISMPGKLYKLRVFWGLRELSRQDAAATHYSPNTRVFWVRNSTGLSNQQGSFLLFHFKTDFNFLLVK